MQHLGLTADGGAADQCTFRQSRIGVVRVVAGREAGAQNQRVTGVLAAHGAGQHETGGKGGLKILEAVHGEVDPTVQQGFMDFLGEQPLAANLGQSAILDLITCRVDQVLLKRVHVAQNGTESRQACQERARLPQCERRPTRADTQRKLPPMLRGRCLLASGCLGCNFLQGRRRGRL